MPVLFATTLFASAALVFLIQPMTAKAVLPAFGGTPAVWNTCMVFFQAVLLAGYAYAHVVTSRWTVRRQLVVHACLLGCILVLLQLVIGPSFLIPAAARPDEVHPLWWLLGMLAVSVGLPFFALSATAPLLQRWFAGTTHPSARDPYFLYGASNLGSLVALVGYPLLLEPNARLVTQMAGWDAGFVALAVLVILCGQRAVATRRAGPSGTQGEPYEQDVAFGERITVLTRLRWLALAFVPSSLLYGVTTYLTTDIASVPLLWVVPLALYLITFILAFSRMPLMSHRSVLHVLPLFVLGQTFVFAIQGLRPLWLLPLLHLLTFFVVALACHGELARTRPDPRHLTQFYLLLSCGGVLGGLFNTLAAPLLFDSLVEYPLALVLACFLVPVSGVAERDRSLNWQDLWLPLILFLLATSLIPIVRANVTALPVRVSLIYGLPAAVCYSFVNRPVRFGLGVGVVMLAGATTAGESQSHLVYGGRSFFGVVRVLDVLEVDRPKSRLRRFVHGNTLHGMQRIRADRTGSDEPLTYYFRNGPIGDFFSSRRHRSARNFAVLGLGAGTLMSYAEIGQDWTFYEIDPAVNFVARRYFTFIDDAQQRGSSCAVEIGDGRLLLEQAATGGFDVIFADAFSSDAVPVHLLTRQAMEIYLDKLAPGGVIVLNITNRCLDLEPVVANLAKAVNMVALIRVESSADISDTDKRAGKTPSGWVVVGRTADDLGNLVGNPRWRALCARQDVGLWTDDYSNLIQVLRW